MYQIPGHSGRLQSLRPTRPRCRPSQRVNDQIWVAKRSNPFDHETWLDAARRKRPSRSPSETIGYMARGYATTRWRTRRCQTLLATDQHQCEQSRGHKEGWTMQCRGLSVSTLDHQLVPASRRLGGPSTMALMCSSNAKGNAGRRAGSPWPNGHADYRWQVDQRFALGVPFPVRSWSLKIQAHCPISGWATMPDQVTSFQSIRRIAPLLGIRSSSQSPTLPTRLSVRLLQAPKRNPSQGKSNELLRLLSRSIDVV